MFTHQARFANVKGQYQESTSTLKLGILSHSGGARKRTEGIWGPVSAEREHLQGLGILPLFPERELASHPPRDG